MKKVILLAIGCLAYVSVQAQSVVSPEQIKKVIDTQIQTITSKVDFSDTQKEFLNQYVAYTIKSRTKSFKKEAMAMQIKDVNMNTFFTEKQRKTIKDILNPLHTNGLTTRTPASIESTESPKTGF